MKETADLSSGRHDSRFTSESKISVPYELVFDKEAQGCAGESQSPIDVEWPENSLENAQPGELNFEGYDRVRKLKMPNHIARSGIDFARDRLRR